MYRNSAIYLDALLCWSLIMFQMAMTHHAPWIQLYPITACLIQLICCRQSLLQNPTRSWFYRQYPRFIICLQHLYQRYSSRAWNHNDYGRLPCICDCFRQLVAIMTADCKVFVCRSSDPRVLNIICCNSWLHSSGPPLQVQYTLGCTTAMLKIEVFVGVEAIVCGHISARGQKLNNSKDSTCSLMIRRSMLVEATHNRRYPPHTTWTHQSGIPSIHIRCAVLLCIS